MKRKHDISPVSRFFQRNPAWAQVACVAGVALLIILGPVLLYGLLFHAGPDSMRMLSDFPWWPIVLLVALVALLSLLQGSTGVSVQKLPDKKGDGTDARSTEQSDRSDQSDQSDQSEPASGSGGPPGASGPPGNDSDPVRCTMHERTVHSLGGVDKYP